MHGVGDAIDLLLLLLSAQAIMIASLLGSLSLVMARDSLVNCLRWWLAIHFVTYHALSTIYQFSFALLSSLVDGCLSEVARLLTTSHLGNHFLLVDA